MVMIANDDAKIYRYCTCSPAAVLHCKTCYGTHTRLLWRRICARAFEGAAAMPPDVVGTVLVPFLCPDDGSLELRFESACRTARDKLAQSTWACMLPRPEQWVLGPTDVSTDHGILCLRACRSETTRGRSGENVLPGSALT